MTGFIVRLKEDIRASDQIYSLKDLSDHIGEQMLLRAAWRSSLENSKKKKEGLIRSERKVKFSSCILR